MAIVFAKKEHRSEDDGPAAGGVHDHVDPSPASPGSDRSEQRSRPRSAPLCSPRSCIRRAASRCGTHATLRFGSRFGVVSFVRPWLAGRPPGGSRAGDPVRCPVDRAAGPVDDSVGSGPGDDPVGSHRQCPAAFVGEVVVPAADGCEVVDVRFTVEPPEDDVVDLTLFERHLAAVADAGGVHRSEFAALGSVDGSCRSTEVGDFSVAIEDVGDDVRVAAQSAHLGHRYGNSVVRLADAVLVQSVEQRGQVDEHADLGNPEVGQARLPRSTGHTPGHSWPEPRWEQWAAE